MATSIGLLTQVAQRVLFLQCCKTLVSFFNVFPMRLVDTCGMRNSLVTFGDCNAAMLMAA